MVFLGPICCGLTSATMATPTPKPADFTLSKEQYGLHCHSEKVRNVKERLVKISSGNCMKELLMIDHIQRLGIDHIFRNEIGDALERQYVECYSKIDRNAWCTDPPHHHLHEVALRFRLLRQQGYHVPADIFEKFRTIEGKFEDGLSRNIQGLISLFEASHMSIEGDDILDEANAFTRKLLEDQADKIPKSILNLPYHKSLSRFTAMDELLHSADDCNSEGWLTEVREVAKMDLNMAIMAYRDEFHHFSKWWKELGLGEELKLIRQQPLKWYIWAVAALPDPLFAEERLDITKPISLLYVVDDLFDVYGDIHHLSLFTQAINRWDINAADDLPDYMRSTWRAVFDTTNEISHKIFMKHGWNPKTYLHKLWADFCNACLIEARWNTSGYLPTTSEYLKIAAVTSGVPMILCHGFFLLTESLNSKTVQLLDDNPIIISSVANILRLSDDLGSAKDEGQDGYDGSYLNCYRQENDGVSIGTTREHVDRMILDAWKELNKGCLHLEPHPFSSAHNFGRVCLNSARMVPLMYGYEQGRLPGLDKFFKMLLHGR